MKPGVIAVSTTVWTALCALVTCVQALDRLPFGDRKRVLETLLKWYAA